MINPEGYEVVKFLPAGWNREDEFLRAFIGDSEGVGAIAQEIQALADYIKYESRTTKADVMTGKELDYLGRVFLGLIRRHGETALKYRNTFLGIIRRGGAPVFGTKWDILWVFQQIMAKDIAFDVVEYTNAINLVQNADFDFLGDPWYFNGMVELNLDAKFTALRGVDLYGPTGEAAQTFSSDLEGEYILHWYLRGTCGVQIENAVGHWWNGEQGLWQGERFTNYYAHGTTQDTHTDVFIDFTLSGRYEQVTAHFVWGGQRGHIDHVRCYRRPGNPSFSLVVRYQGTLINTKTFHLDRTYAQGDPDPFIDYRLKGYFDYSPIVGRRAGDRVGWYEFLMDLVCPKGVQYCFDETFIENPEFPPNRFLLLETDGTPLSTSTKVTLHFKDPLDLMFADILLNDTDTGVMGYALVKIDERTYDYYIGNMVRQGVIGVTVDRDNLTPYSRSIMVYQAIKVDYLNLEADGFDVAFNPLEANGWFVDFIRLKADGFDVAFIDAQANHNAVDFDDLTANGYTVDFLSALPDGYTVDFISVTPDYNTVDFISVVPDHNTVDFSDLTVYPHSVDFEQLEADGFTVEFEQLETDY